MSSSRGLFSRYLPLVGIPPRKLARFGDFGKRTKDGSANL
jgi:hypothetical protein